MTDGAMTVTAPAGDELSDWFGPRRTPAEKAADRLRAILACDRHSRAWSGSRNPHGQMPWPEVVCILAGIDPEGPGDAAEGYFPFLPGALDSYGIDAEDARKGGDHIALSVSERVDFLLGLNLPTCDPHIAIKAALDAGFTPPWWPWAREDEICAPLLPDAPEASQRPAAGRGTPSVRQIEVNRKNIGTRWANDPKRKALYEDVLPLFERYRVAGFKPSHWEHGRKGKPSAASLALDIEEEIRFALADRPEAIPSYGQILDFVRDLLRESGDTKLEGSGTNV